MNTVPGILDRLSMMNTCNGWYRKYSNQIELHVAGRPRRSAGRIYSSSAAIFWAELDRLLREIYMIPPRLAGDACFNFQADQDVLDVVSRCIPLALGDTYRMTTPERVPIQEFIDLFNKHFDIEIKTLGSRIPVKNEPDVEAPVTKVNKPLPPDPDDLLAGEDADSKEDLGERKLKTTNTLKLGPALHGTIGCLRTKGGQDRPVIFLSGLRASPMTEVSKTSVEIKVPIVCKVKYVGPVQMPQAFDFPLAGCVLESQSKEFCGMTGNLTPIALGLGVKCKTFERWYINMNEIGKYRDLADRIAENVPSVAKNGDLLMGDPFSAEMLKEINMVLMATDTTKMQTSIRDWAEIRGFINDSLTVGRPTFLTVGDVMPEQPVVPEVTPVVEPVVVTPDGPEGLLELNPEKPEREVLTFREMERLAEALQDLMECVEKAKKEVERAEKDYVSLVRRGVAVTKEVQRMEALQKEPKKKESEKGWFSWFRRG